MYVRIVYLWLGWGWELPLLPLTTENNVPELLILLSKPSALDVLQFSSHNILFYIGFLFIIKKTVSLFVLHIHWAMAMGIYLNFCKHRMSTHLAHTSNFFQVLPIAMFTLGLRLGDITVYHISLDDISCGKPYGVLDSSQNKRGYTVMACSCP